MKTHIKGPGDEKKGGAGKRENYRTINSVKIFEKYIGINGQRNPINATNLNLKSLKSPQALRMPLHKHKSKKATQ